VPEVAEKEIKKVDVDVNKVMADAAQKAVHCPICKNEQVFNHKIHDSTDTMVTWYHCGCGTVFHTQGLDKAVFDADYVAKWFKMKEIEPRLDYFVRTYFGQISHLTYGRKFLDVGFTIPVMMESLKKKGWITTGVDIIPNDYMTDDFATFEFQEKFDVIHLGHVLESIGDPIAALKKAFGMLNDMGVLVITHPCPELLFELGPRAFGHFTDYRERHVFLSGAVIKNIASQCGFEEKYYVRNQDRKFAMWNDAHYIYQKRPY